jgi:hypothetical protein
MTDIDIIVDCFFVFLSMVITAIAYDFAKDLIRQCRRERRMNRRILP